MNSKLTLRVLGSLITIYSFILLLPAIVSQIYDEQEYTIYFLSPCLILLFLGVSILFFTRHTKAVASLRQTLFLVPFSWFIVSLLGTIPFIVSRTIPDFSSAFFETVSGFTTTGASILQDIEALPKAMLFWRSLTHWLGGMGIVVLTVALFPLIGIGGNALMAAESPGPELNKITPKISNVAKIFWLIYTGLTLLETLLLTIAGMDIFEAITHSFATMATGGFSTKNASIAAYSSPAIQWIITVFMFFAGTNFALYFALLTRNFTAPFKDTEFRWYLSITFGAGILIAGTLFLTQKLSIETALRDGFFQTISILTTTGFVSTDFELWHFFPQAMLFFLMFFGGCAGSTGGGIKIIRITTTVKFLLSELVHFFIPQKVTVIKINNKKIDYDYIKVVLVFILSYIFIVLLTTVVVSLQNIDLLSSFTTALATLGNIGPGFGSIGPTDNYALFSPPIKIFLSFVMIAGRLELFTILILFSPRYWR